MRISAYDFGRMTVDGRDYGSDLIIHAGRVHDSWWREEGHRLDLNDLDRLWDEPPAILVVGTGFYGRMMVPPETRDAISARGIEIRTAKTAEAVALFNTLSASPDSRVDGAFHLTC